MTVEYEIIDNSGVIADAESEDEISSIWNDLIARTGDYHDFKPNGEVKMVKILATII
ncbi:hypothetical protein LCGC14_0175580 [marine sediment metagenome]|uniref:Uncharacterized protein n=1 Tax=marine sediment metagenome TaxID=412755 RepID=A0A0F9UVC1_9ZZZZ